MNEADDLVCELIKFTHHCNLCGELNESYITEDQEPKYCMYCGKELKLFGGKK